MQLLSSTSNGPVQALAQTSSSHLIVERLGLISFRDGRLVQNERVVQCRETGRESLLWCEHPPTITLGRSVDRTTFQATDWRSKGIDLVDTDRAGGATYHGPGQLVLYPVIHLRNRRIGVRAFVSTILNAFRFELVAVGVPAEVRLDTPGLWIGDRKLGSVGLRIEGGISNHGYSLNCDCNLSAFDLFTACNLPGVIPTSIASWAEANGCQPTDGAKSAPNESHEPLSFSAGEIIDRVSRHISEALKPRVK